MDLNRIYNKMKQLGYLYKNEQNVTIDKRYIANMEVDIRVVITWDQDNVDVELHCEEPTGERCNAFHNRTRIGGLLSKDFTGGYGPEEYLIRNAFNGTYLIYAKLSTSNVVAMGYSY